MNAASVIEDDGQRHRQRTETRVRIILRGGGLVIALFKPMIRTSNREQESCARWARWFLATLPISLI